MSVARRLSLTERAALRVLGNSAYNEEVFSSTLATIGDREFGDVLSRDETLELLATTASFPGRTDVDPVPGRVPIPGDVPARAPRLLDYVLTKPTDAALIQYTRETSRPDPAVETAKGDLAPDASADDFEAIEARVREIPVFLTAARSEIADLPSLETLFATRLTSSVRGRLEHQLVQGNGSGENLVGILDDTVSVPTVTRDTTGNELFYETCLRGITSVRTTLLDEPNVIAVHPHDYHTILDERDHDSHLVLSGEERAERKIESVPLVPTTAVPQGIALAGAFDIGCAIRLRSGTSVTITDQHADYFTRRLVAILASLRAAVVVPTPLAFCEIVLL